jgi:hypothetical protein
MWVKSNIWMIKTRQRQPHEIKQIKPTAWGSEGQKGTFHIPG